MKRIAFLSDLHLDEPFPMGHAVFPRENFETALQRLSADGIDEIIFGGDIGEAAAHTYFFEKLKNFKLNLVLGNHDNCRDVCVAYPGSCQNEELFYSTEDNEFKYLFLDSSSGIISSIQIDWLYAAVKTEKQLIIVIHHPLIEIDTPADRLFPLQNRVDILSLLADTQKEITVFCGHYHMVDVSRYRNIVQFTTPSLSYQLEKNAPELVVENTRFGFRMIELEGGQINTRVIWLTDRDRMQA